MVESSKKFKQYKIVWYNSIKVVALQLPLSSIKGFMISRAKVFIIHITSKDRKVVSASIEVSTGRKCRKEATRELANAEERLRHKTRIGTVTKRRTGHRCFESPQYSKVKRKERQHLFQKEVRDANEETRIN